jgi:hypothetical protein
VMPATIIARLIKVFIPSSRYIKTVRIACGVTRKLLYRLTHGLLKIGLKVRRSVIGVSAVIAVQ